MDDPEVNLYLKANEMASSDNPEDAAIGRLTKEVGMLMPNWTADEILRGTSVEDVFNAAVRFHATSLASTVLAITESNKKNTALDYTVQCLISLFNEYKKSYYEKSEKREEKR